jgi:hypothetical protein
MLLVRPVIASSANHVRAVFSPYAKVLNILYATAMQQQEVQAGNSDVSLRSSKGVSSSLLEPFCRLLDGPVTPLLSLDKNIL